MPHENIVFTGRLSSGEQYRFQYRGDYNKLKIYVMRGTDEFGYTKIKDGWNFTAWYVGAEIKEVLALFVLQNDNIVYAPDPEPAMACKSADLVEIIDLHPGAWQVPRKVISVAGVAGGI